MRAPRTILLMTGAAATIIVAGVYVFAFLRITDSLRALALVLALLSLAPLIAGIRSLTNTPMRKWLQGAFHADAWIGKLVHVTPNYGEGWSLQSDDSDHADSDVDIPAPFQARILRIAPSNDTGIASGMARVEQNGHEHHDSIVTFTPRHAGFYTFDSGDSAYSIVIAQQARRSSASGPQLHGFAEISSRPRR